MSNSQRQKIISLPRLAKLACTSSVLLQHQQAQAVAIDELLNSNILAQVDADLSNDALSFTQQELIDGMINNMAQDGVIRIPIKK